MAVAGALAGLVFVSLSINLTRILQLPSVPGRAAETIVLLGGALIGALAALVPTLSATSLGASLVVIGALTWGFPMVVQIRTFRRREYWRLGHAIWRFTAHNVATLPLLAAGASLLGWLPGGLAWFALAALLCLALALINAWILLVEIMR